MTLTARQRRVRTNKIHDKTLALRTHLWPGLDERTLWVRTEKTGFITIPRLMPLILRIMDGLAAKGKPVSSTYFTLWCRVFDECVLTISNPQDVAFESGFTGQRRETTWASRMKILCDLGFIDARPGSSGKYHYVLILNPYLVIIKHHKKNLIPEEKIQRAVCQSPGCRRGRSADEYRQSQYLSIIAPHTRGEHREVLSLLSQPEM